IRAASAPVRSGPNVQLADRLRCPSRRHGDRERDAHSFSDGGRFLDAGAAVAHGLELVAAGADLLDVGGDSTRPGATPVAPDDERARVLPVVRRLATEAGVPVSVDSRRASVAAGAIEAGAAMVHDVSAGRFDADMARVVAEAGVGFVLVHMPGDDPRAMQDDP